ncbi:MAG TPA: nucleoside diphosphate kinase regulator [Woeseiaceae bacterium]|nr:nucleoside diphosphate kinase regulator [Woeseiaceae bacterium]
MNQLPNIIVSSTDLQRLDALIQARKGPDSPGLQSLKDELARATIVEPRDVPATVVTMNSTVRFAMEPTGREFELTLVYPKDVDGESNTISVLAPVGSALLGLSVGQEIAWPMPRGRTVTVRILEVTYQPERAGNLVH